MTSDGPDAARDGTARDAAPPKDSEKARERGAQRGALAVELEVSRQRSASWTVFGIVVGALLVWKLGTVGVWAGFALIAAGLYHAWNLVQTFRHPPGTILVSDSSVTLPRGLCVPDPVVAARSEVTAAYFLRRSVPWNHAAPVLIIELGDKAMAFPRDWFASESDQRHVIHALLRDKLAGEPAGDDAAAK